jgi:hypothetical protein
MATSKLRRSRVQPIWERGHYSHGYWHGKEKLGGVKLGPPKEWDGVYRWHAGTHTGEAATLDEAKRAVEQAVLVGASQLGLF